MSFKKISTLFLVLGFLGQVAKAATRGDRRKLQEQEQAELMHVPNWSKGTSSKSSSKSSSSSDSEYCGGRMEPCCDGLKCSLPGLGCQTFAGGSFVKYPRCKQCGGIGDPCCQHQCPKGGYGAKDTCSLSCNSGLTCSSQNVCAKCGDKNDLCCVDGEGQETCNEGYVCELGRCMECGDATQSCCVGCEGKKFCDLGRVCDGGVCRACGGKDVQSGNPQRCCEDKQGNPFCDDGRTCVNGVCELCGDKQEVCCVDSLGHKFCDRGRNCENNVCRLCGDKNEPCCEEGIKCSNDGGDRKRTCLVGSNLCANCGRSGEVCCDSIDDFPLCDPGLSCNAGRGRCEVCGTAGQACCEGEPKCSVDEFCNPGNHRCETCGGDNEVCCPDGITCRSDGYSCSSENICRNPNNILPGLQFAIQPGTGTFVQFQSGPLVANQPFEVVFDALRLSFPSNPTCPAFGAGVVVTANVMSDNSGIITSFSLSGGHLKKGVAILPACFEGSTEIQVWFERTEDGNSCFDSNFSNNYAFPVICEE